MRVSGRAWRSAVVVGAGLALLGSTFVSHSGSAVASLLAWDGVAGNGHPDQRPSARVSGRIVTRNGRQLLSGAVMMVQLGERATTLPAGDLLIGSDGLFLFRNVAPGRYEIRALGEVDRQGTSLYGTSSVSVGNENADGILVTLTPGAIVEGRLELEGSRGLPLRGGFWPRVRAAAADGIQFGDALSEPIEPDGRFRFRGVMPGPHVFRVDGLPSPWILRAVYLDEREITEVPIPLRSNQRVRNLRVLVTDRPQATACEVGTAPPREPTPAAQSTKR